MRLDCDFLVIGGGIAGLSYARKVAPHGRVVLLTKEDLPESASAYAQGGIAGVWDPEDSFEAHVNDTIEAGAGLCHRDVVETVVREGPDRIRELIELGTRFSAAAGPDDGPYDLGREGGHSHRRILHASDATGFEIVRALIEACRATPNIEIHERHAAIDLIVGRHGDGRTRCLGAWALDQRTNEVHTINAKVTMIATGGAGKVYLYTSNPDLATGDGIAMAYRAGASVGNMEFYQFHPTCLFHPHAKSFLISEALRGEGARLRLPDGSTFAGKYDARAELAPRDVVARAIDHEMKTRGFECVYLDISHREADFVRTRFPTIYEKCLGFGIDITSQPIPVVPAAHYCCGGVVADARGRTDVVGLYACGEAAMTGLHGANRLASNSLLEAIVFAHRAAEDAHAAVQELAAPLRPAPPWNPGDAVDSDESVVVTQNWDEIRRFMWNYVGIVRTNRRLERARKRLCLLEEEIRDYYWNFHVTSDLIELRNIAVVADLIIESAIRRRESRGLHANRDYPDRSTALAEDTILRRPLDLESPHPAAAANSRSVT